MQYDGCEPEEEAAAEGDPVYMGYLAYKEEYPDAPDIRPKVSWPRFHAEVGITSICGSSTYGVVCETVYLRRLLEEPETFPEKSQEQIEQVSSAICSSNHFCFFPM